MRPSIKSHNERFNHATKFAEIVTDTADETQVIDLILSMASPVSSREGIADHLISRFGNYQNVIAAPVEELVQIDGVGTAGAYLFKLIQLTAQRSLRPDFEKPVKISQISDIIAYLQSIMRYEKKETLRVIFLNKKNQVISQRLMSEGTIDVVPIFRREIIKLALSLNATALILAHNHPSGDPTPTEPDIWETLRLRDACDIFDIKIHDHLIIGNGSWSSLRALGHL